MQEGSHHVSTTERLVCLPSLPQDWHPKDHISFYSKLDKSRVHATETDKLEKAKLFDEVCEPLPAHVTDPPARPFASSGFKPRIHSTFHTHTHTHTHIPQPPRSN